MQGVDNYLLYGVNIEIRITTEEIVNIPPKVSTIVRDLVFLPDKIRHLNGSELLREDCDLAQEKVSLFTVNRNVLVFSGLSCVAGNCGVGEVEKH